MNERIFYRGHFIELSILQTHRGDYLGIAKFPGSLASGICRNIDKKTARQLCIERLLDNKHLINKTEKNEY